ncbi:MAG: alpha/beta hydrolase [Rhodobacterales bacterium]|nr:alpha/beta hydrolase [Rhodobacterales bacterium]
MTRLLIVMALLTAGLAALLGPIERAMLYPFDTTRISPADAGVPRLTEVRFTSDTQTLILWTAPPKPGKPVILYFHGNAGNLANRAGRFRHFLDRGYGLVAPAYRGSSGSTGTPAEADLTADAAAILAALPDFIPDLTPENVILYGESLGTGIAIQLATTTAAKSIAGVILEAPYTSIPDVTRTLYPLLVPVLRAMTNTWESLARAPALTQPLLILHGDQDRLIPIEQGRQIFAAAPSLNKQFIAVQGATHTTIWRSDVLPEIWAFIDGYADK